jgi:hypothetical protein
MFLCLSFHALTLLLVSVYCIFHTLWKPRWRPSLLCRFRCFSLFSDNYWKLMYTCAWELAATVTATTLCLGGNTITNLCHLFSTLFSNWVCCWKSYLELWPRQRRYAASLPCGSNAVFAGLCSTVLENYTSAILDDPVAKVTTWFAFLSTHLFVSGWRAQFSSSYSNLLSIFRLRNQWF